MWILIVLGLIVLVLMAIGGSSGARKTLGALIVGALVLVVVIVGWISYKKRQDAKDEARRAAREAVCRAPQNAECIYRELTKTTRGIASAIVALRSGAVQMNKKDFVEALDGLLGASGSVTVSDDQLRRLILYRIRPECPHEKTFYLQVEFTLSPEEDGVTRIDTWWQGAEDGAAYLREWDSCVARPSHVDYNLHDSKLSAIVPRVLRPPRGPVPTSDAPAELSDKKAPRPDAEPASLSEGDDPCAVGIDAAERLRRLRKYGPVRETGSRSYRAGGHTVVLGHDNKLIYCH